MIKGLFSLVFLLTTLAAIAQHPFNYGQNKKVYFITAEQRDEWGMNFISYYRLLPKGDNGGMGNTADFFQLYFDSTGFTTEWLTGNDTTDIDEARYINGENYTFGKKLISASGEGYGSFISTTYDDLKDGDTVRYCSGTCTGHCSPDTYDTYPGELVYDRSGQLIYYLRYPTISIPWSDMEGGDDDTSTFLPAPEGIPDTIHFKYDANGNLSPMPTPEIPEFYEGLRAHQCMVGDTTMEEVIKKHIGFLPETLFVEIYKYGAALFVLNKKDKKYNYSWDVILEDQRYD